MKRLTYRLEDQYGNPTDSIILESSLIFLKSSEKLKMVLSRLAAIEDILGEEYELEEIRKVIRCKDCEHMWAVSALPGECYCRLRGEVVPRDGYCHRGKAALKAREQDG